MNNYHYGTISTSPDLIINVSLLTLQDLNSGKTALHSVVEKGSLSDVQFMLETCRANINGVTYTGCTPLHIAAGRGDIALTAYLLSMGANPDLVTDEGDTALDLAGSDQVCMCLCVCV